VAEQAAGAAPEALPRRQERRARQEVLPQQRQQGERVEQQARPAERVAWVRLLPPRLAFSPQTGQSVSSRAAAFLPGRLP